jgi:hypothetical protein
MSIVVLSVCVFSAAFISKHVIDLKRQIWG